MLARLMGAEVQATAGEAALPPPPRAKGGGSRVRTGFALGGAGAGCARDARPHPACSRAPAAAPALPREARQQAPGQAGTGVARRGEGGARARVRPQLRRSTAPPGRQGRPRPLPSHEQRLPRGARPEVGAARRGRPASRSPVASGAACLSPRGRTRRWAQQRQEGPFQEGGPPGSPSCRRRCPCLCLPGCSTMVSVTMATSEWIQFFKEAGIPPGPAVNYAVMFVDNRIQKNMLMDLNKEIMNELGVTIVGDIIAILKHAKVVYRQEMCKAATESVASSQTTLQSELRRNANSAATRMIANSLSRDSPPSTPVRRPDTSTSKISITVSNKMAAKNAKAALCSSGAENSTVPVKRRRVTAEMEGKYIVHMPKGTTPRTKKILEQQAAKGLQRTSVFDRLGAETSADTTTGSKPTGVFSRLGDMQEAEEEEKVAESDDDDSSVLQYAGVLKKFFQPSKAKESCKAGVTVKAKATSSEPMLVAAAAAPTPLQRLGSKSPAGPAAAAAAAAPIKGKKRELSLQGGVAKRLGKRPLPTEAQDSSVTSSRSRPDSEFRVTIKRTLGSTKVLALP